MLACRLRGHVSMDEYVMVLVGEWECKEGGIWRFQVSDIKYAKCVDLEEEDKFIDLEKKIAKVFGIDTKRTKIELSFWYEGGETVFTY